MLLRADARFLPLKDASVQCMVTSPPYWGLRNYGLGDAGIGLELSPDAYMASLLAVFVDVWRVLREDGTVWLNLGDAYCGGGRGGNPDDSPFRKQATNVGSLVERSQIPRGLKPKDLIGIPWRVAFALQAAGWYLRSDIIWAKPNPMPESVTDRPTKAHEYLFLLSKSVRYYYNADAIKEPYAGSTLGLELKTLAEKCAGLGRNKRTVWTITLQPFRGVHFATFPEKLVEPCILAGSRRGDVILDPFCGSGTVGVVADAHQRRFVGVDLKAEYLSMAQARIAQRHVSD